MALSLKTKKSKIAPPKVVKMRLVRFAFPASFKKNFSVYFSPKFLKSSFLNAIFLSAFIFFSIFENSALSIFGLLLFLIGAWRTICANAIIWAWSGFFVGIFWFYWMSFSLIYYDFAYLIPIEILGLGLIEGAIFLAIYLIFRAFNRLINIKNSRILEFLLLALGFYSIQFVHPFGFNWLNWQLPLIDTPFEKVLISKNSRIPPFKVEVANTNISQSQQWSKEGRALKVKENFAIIDNAINKGARLVILPETAFSYTLNLDIDMINTLLEKSQKIAILLGAEAYENGVSYNSAYFFDKGEFRRIDKHILVPFGEEIPLPDFIKKPINSLFFDGASDYGKADDFSYIEVDGVKIKVAICYEGSRYELYADKPEFVALISNNAWFALSSQSYLQRLILKYYAQKNGSTILHSANSSKAEIIN